jgi:hypothetical protein
MYSSSANGICTGCWLYTHFITMRPARTWDWPRTRRYDELFNDPDPSSPRQFCPDYIIATPGYDFQEGQGADVVMTTSALLRNGPHCVKELLAGTVSWLSARDIESVGKIRGLLSQRNFRNPDSFGRANYMKILQGYEHYVRYSPEGGHSVERLELRWGLIRAVGRTKTS